MFGCGSRRRKRMRADGGRAVRGGMATAAHPHHAGHRAGGVELRPKRGPWDFIREVCGAAADQRAGAPPLERKLRAIIPVLRAGRKAHLRAAGATGLERLPQWGLLAMVAMEALR